MKAFVEAWWAHAASATGQATFALGALLLLERLCARRAPRLRYALLGLACLKLAWPPAWDLGGMHPAGYGSRLARDWGAHWPWPAPRAMGFELDWAGGLTGAAGEGSIHEGLDPRVWLCALHFAGMAAMGLWLALHALRLRRMAAGARAFEPPASPPARLFASSFPALRPRIALSAAAPGPLAFGILRPTILLPPGLVRSMRPDELAVVVEHERTHLAHRDPLASLIVALLAIPWWFHPFYWLLARSVRRVQEDLCDDALVARPGLDRERYCALLLRAAQGLAGRTSGPLTSNIATSTHPLARRFRRLLDPARPGSGSPKGKLTMIERLWLPILALLLIPGARGAAQAGDEPQARIGDGFAQAVKQPAGSPHAGIERGLAWLAARQGLEGAFANSGAAGPSAAGTGLALLAFLGAGNTEKVGPYRAQVAKGLAYLRSRSMQAGSTLERALATYALAEARVLSGGGEEGLQGRVAALQDELRRDPLALSTRAFGGLALFAARDAGCEVDVALLSSLAQGCALQGGDAQAAVGLFLRALGGGDVRGEESLRRAARSLALQAGRPGALEDPLLLHFGSYALFQVGGELWQQWNAVIPARIAAAQGESGSWSAAPSAPGGAVGQAALHVLSLEVAYRYARVVR